MISNLVRPAQGTEPGRASAKGGPVSSEHQRQVDDEVEAQDSKKAGNNNNTYLYFKVKLKVTKKSNLGGKGREKER